MKNPPELLALILFLSALLLSSTAFSQTKLATKANALPGSDLPLPPNISLSGDEFVFIHQDGVIIFARELGVTKRPNNDGEGFFYNISFEITRIVNTTNCYARLSAKISRMPWVNAKSCPNSTTMWSGLSLFPNYDTGTNPENLKYAKDWCQLDTYSFEDWVAPGHPGYTSVHDFMFEFVKVELSTCGDENDSRGAAKRNESNTTIASGGEGSKNAGTGTRGGAKQQAMSNENTNGQLQESSASEQSRSTKAVRTAGTPDEAIEFILKNFQRYGKSDYRSLGATLSLKGGKLIYTNTYEIKVDEVLSGLRQRSGEQVPWQVRERLKTDLTKAAYYDSTVRTIDLTGVYVENGKFYADSKHLSVQCFIKDARGSDRFTEVPLLISERANEFMRHSKFRMDLPIDRNFYWERIVVMYHSQDQQVGIPGSFFDWSSPAYKDNNMDERLTNAFTDLIKSWNSKATVAEKY